MLSSFSLKLNITESASEGVAYKSLNTSSVYIHKAVLFIISAPSFRSCIQCISCGS